MASYISKALKNLALGAAMLGSSYTAEAQTQTPTPLQRYEQASLTTPTPQNISVPADGPTPTATTRWLIPPPRSSPTPPELNNSPESAVQLNSNEVPVYGNITKV